MDSLKSFIDLILHLDVHLAAVFQEYGIWTISILALILFCETGLVVTPFLPGDSLLFAAGALSAQVSMNVHLLVAVLLVAAILGDTVNYHIGKFVGPKVFERKNSRIFRPEYIERTQRFFDKYGNKTIVIARFVPIVRTFAPFLAGVGKMKYNQFIIYNVAGALLWVLSLTYAGYFFGEIPIIKKNFSLVVLGIIVVSFIPVITEFIRAKRESSAAKSAAR